MTKQQLFTVEQATSVIGLSARRVREIAAELGLGQLVTSRCRLLSAAEVEQIRLIAASSKPGRKPKT